MALLVCFLIDFFCSQEQLDLPSFEKRTNTLILENVCVGHSITKQNFTDFFSSENVLVQS